MGPNLPRRGGTAGTVDGSNVPFLRGGGEMGARLRAFDWTSSPLGPPADWPQSLKTAVRIMLTSRQPMFVWWGESLINLYNDPYRAIVGGKHPAALGQPASVVWREIWNEVAPRAQSVMERDEGTYDEALLLIMERNGYPEETYYTFSYSPVPTEDGGTGGIICANTDDTRRIVGERQLALLRELAAQTAEARTFDEACSRSAAALGTNPRDLPFAMIYLVDPEAQCVHHAGTSGIAPDHPAVPERVGLDEDGPWPFAAVVASHRPQLVSGLRARWGDLPAGAWDLSPDHAVLLPIAPSGQTGKAGVLVAALNPFRLYDDDYRGFLDLVSGQIAASIGNAQAYEDERRRAEALAELDRAKTVFFSNVSHEFRTPLTLMLGPIEELLASEAEAGRRAALDLLQRNAVRLQKLVNALLDFSRLEAGRLQANPEPTDLATLTADLASTFRSACERAGLALVVDCPPLPSPVPVDRDMWEKIVLNLLSNAFKFTFAGSITVQLRAVGDRVELTVADTGTGIAPDQLPHVFERFRRVDGARARTHEGTGIGLALVQELTRLHGGTVEVESTVDAGSRFVVAIAADRTAAAEGASPRPSSAGSYVAEASRWVADDSAPEVDAGGRPRVLLADDNADMRAYVTRLLGDHYAVDAVGDGQAALESARRRPPDLILSDVMMPRLDGIGLLRALRADGRTRTVPVILLSARAGEEARFDALDDGADDYLVKPFTARELLVRVRASLALARLRRQAEVALRESEARFRDMADHAPMMVWVTEPDGRASFLSSSWYAFTGQSPETALGFGWLDAVHPDDRPASRAAFERANVRQEAFRLEYRLRRHDGSWAWAIDAATPYLDADGTFAGYIGSVIDITDRRLAEERLRDADRRKDEFLATLAHELRNPLAPIRNALGLLRHGEDAARAPVHAMMERQVNQMVRLVDDLLEVSRITHGNIELRHEDVVLADVLANAVETSRPLLEAARHELVVRTPPERLVLHADPVRLAQVFANLLNNAAKYTPPGGHVAIDVRRDDDHAVIVVRDDGVGIPVDQLPAVFDVFMQVGAARPIADGGLGVGLTLVRRLVEMHGGRVDAHSEGLGRGSEFVVRLPLAVVRQPAAVEPVRAPPPAPPAHARRVLVVDDNADAAESLAMLLQIEGMETEVAHDGPSALAAVRAFRPTTVLLDVGMPGMDGHEVARRIREVPELAGVRLIALTGWGQPEDRRRSRDAGFDHHLVKPVDFGTLQALLSS